LSEAIQLVRRNQRQTVTNVMHVIFVFVFDRNFEILILWNSGRDCRVTTAIVSSSS